MRTPRSRIVARLLFVAFVVVALLALRPAPSPIPENCEIITGIAESVRAGDGPGDVVVQIADDNAYYYINRGLDYGLHLPDLQESLVGQEVTVAYVRHWSTLNLAGRNRHIASISVAGQEIYSEMQ